MGTGGEGGKKWREVRAERDGRRRERGGRVGVEWWERKGRGGRVGEEEWGRKSGGGRMGEKG